MVKLKDVRERVLADSYSVRDGVFTVRSGFFYRHGREEFLLNAVRHAFPDAVVLDAGEVNKPFRGGASVAQGSHWFVKFRVQA